MLSDDNASDAGTEIVKYWHDQSDTLLVVQVLCFL